MCTFISGLPLETKESCIDTNTWCKENEITYWIMPLFIDPTHVYKSDIDINYKKYGYELHPDGSWTSNLMTFQEAKEIAHNIDATNHKVSAWNMFALLSLNIHTADELYHMKYNELDKNVYQQTGVKRINEYIRRLTEL